MQRPIRLTAAIVYSALSCCGCAGNSGRSSTSVPASLPPGQSEAVLTPVDSAYDPCVNFADFACGTGKRPVGLLQKDSAILVGGKSEAVEAFLDRLVSGAYSDGKRSTVVLRDFYTRCTDPKIRDLGLREVRQYLDQISRITTLPELGRALGALRAGGLQTLVDFEISWEATALDAPVVASVALSAPELDRGVYAGDDRILAAQRTHWQKLAALVGAIAPSDIDGALRVDRWLAASSAPKVSDPASVVQPIISRATFEAAAFPWLPYLSDLGLSAETPIRPTAPDMLARIDALTKLPLADLKSRLKLAAADASAKFIGLPAFEEEIRFHSEVVNGRQHRAFELPQACTDLTSQTLNPWLDEAFRATISIPSEQPLHELFDLLRGHFAQSVAGTGWLDDATRRAAAAKVSGITLRLAAEHDPTLDEIVLRPGSFLGALRQLAAHASALGLGRIGSPGSRTLSFVQNPAAMYSSLVNSVWVTPEFARHPWVHQRPSMPSTSVPLERSWDMSSRTR